MFNTMFVRLMSLFLAVIVVVLMFFSVISYINIRNTITNTRLEELTQAARDIAFISSNARYYELIYNRGILDEYLKFKINEVQNQFGAFIVTVDNTGKIVNNLEGIFKRNSEFAQSLDANNIYATLAKILSGEEIRTKDSVDAKIVYTVGVPYIINNRVQGAVYIHTDAQNIEAEYLPIAKQLISIFVIALALSGIVAAVFTKKIIIPLETIETAVEKFSYGEYKVRAEESGSLETVRLAQAFNAMADNIQKNDQSRRDFVANVSHELRSPVTSINGYISGMLDKTIPEDKINYYLQIVSKETVRLKHLIEDLLSLSKLENDSYVLRPVCFDINEAISRVIINRIGEIEERKIALEGEFGEEPIWVNADFDRIIQVLTNLLDNALKFVADQGIIRFDVKVENHKAVVNIIDNGSGIDEKDVPFLFERFYKHDKSRSNIHGTGLGLAICKQIMELHKEKLYLVATNQGAHFAFTLPLNESKTRNE